MIAGIDYSMTSPGITVYDGDSFSFHFLAKSKKQVGTFLKGKCHGYEYPEWETPEQRFQELTNWTLDVITGCNRVRLEGYAFGAKGASLFQIAENTGLLKNWLWSNKIQFDTIAPTSLKKLATGSGRASKLDMYDAFYEDTKIDLCAALDIKKKDGNPVSDIVDSYFTCKSMLI